MEIKMKCDKNGPCFNQKVYDDNNSAYKLVGNYCAYCGEDLSKLFLELPDDDLYYNNFN